MTPKFPRILKPKIGKTFGSFKFINDHKKAIEKAGSFENFNYQEFKALAANQRIPRRSKFGL